MEETYYQNIINGWIENEKKLTTGNEIAQLYYLEHKNRIDYILGLCRKFKPDKSAVTLDVGRHFLTYKLSEYYSNIWSIGFDIKTSFEYPEFDISKYKEIPNIIFDLNKARFPHLWPKDVKFDLIVCAEVIEHLYEAPEFLLLMLESMLKPNGLIVCTTPNATSAANRIKCLLGKNIQERIRFYTFSPGHYRLYTKNELSEMGSNVNLRVISHIYIDYMHMKNLMKNLLKRLLGIIPSLRTYQIIVFQKKI